LNNPGHLKWIAYGAIVGFGTSFIFGDLITLPLDLYYLVYFGITIAFFTIYIRKTQLNLKEWFSRRLVLGILLGLVFGALIIQIVLSRPATEKFTGPYLAWLILWRGLIYGAIDGLLLSVFPWVVTWRAFDVSARPQEKKIRVNLLALVFVLAITTAYHLGYSDFRSKKIIEPNIGNTIISIPTLASANPIGSPIAHATMHVTAIIHSPKTELFLPPHRK
jgi:hypothetical protein